MSPLNLTEDEIAEITDRVKFNAQVKALRQLGIPVKVRANGKPLVAREAYLFAMGASQGVSSGSRVEPNYEAIQ